MDKKYEVILFQPYLRKFVLNFGKNLPHFSFFNTANPPMTGGSYHKLPTFEKEILRTKDSWKSFIRRCIGIPNVRPYLKRRGNLLFTYGCLLLTHKPYCTYIETGLALYNYDLGIARNPISRWVISLLATRTNCQKLIFVSEAAKKSFFATVKYSKGVREVLLKKSIVIYPIPSEEKGELTPKRFNGSLKLLFPGTFYMKGGMEVVRAYERLRKTYGNTSLTIVTALHMLRKEDIEYMRSLPGLSLRDAKLDEKQMAEMYQSHDILLLPTYREGFGLVLVEALSYSMPLVATDQYATTEMAKDGLNGFTYPNPLRDYDSKTYQMFGKYYNPNIFYSKLFSLQDSGGLKAVEDFLYNSIERYLNDPDLLEKHSKGSIELYKKTFEMNMLSEQIDTVFLESIRKH